MTRKRVLVVDTHAARRRRTVLRLRKMGAVEVWEAATRQDMKKIVVRQSPDYIIMELGHDERRKGH